MYKIRILKSAKKCERAETLGAVRFSGVLLYFVPPCYNTGVSASEDAIFKDQSKFA